VIPALATEADANTAPATANLILRMERSSQAPQRASPCSAGVLHLIT
jgi:hypothetical protein